MRNFLDSLRKYGARRKVTVTCCWDPEAEVWFVEDSSIPGLAADAESIDELVNKVRPMVLDLIACESDPRGEVETDNASDVPFDVLVHGSLKSRLQHC